MFHDVDRDIMMHRGNVNTLFHVVLPLRAPRLVPKISSAAITSSLITGQLGRRLLPRKDRKLQVEGKLMMLWSLRTSEAYST